MPNCCGAPSPISRANPGTGLRRCCNRSVASRKVINAARRWVMSACCSQPEKLRPENRRSTVKNRPLSSPSSMISGSSRPMSLPLHFDRGPAAAQHLAWRLMLVSIEPQYPIMINREHLALAPEPSS